MCNRQKGFSLIELLIVVAIILIIAAIAIPDLLQSRRAANESATAGNLRTINTGLMTFFSTYNNGYPTTDLSQLAPPAAPPSSCAAADMLDTSLAVANPVQKSGYGMTYLPGTALTTAAAGCAAAGVADYDIQAEPISRPSSGNAGFWTDETMLIVKNPSGPCTAINDANCGPL